MTNRTTDLELEHRRAIRARGRRARLVRAAALGVCLLGAWPGGAVRAADAVPGERWCGVPDGDGPAREIGRIEFAGNDVTRAAVLRRELAPRIGRTCSLDDVVDGVQSLMDLDLFRSVRAELVLARDAAVPPGGRAAGGRDGRPGVLVLRYVVREKFFFLAIPRLSRTSEGELRTGVQLRWDNFGGRLHELRITAERRREDDGRGRSGHVRSLDYRVPRFLGSRWGANVELAFEDRAVGFSREGRAFGEGRREAYRLGVGVARWLGSGDGVRGWRLHAGLGLEERTLALASGDTGPYTDGFDASVVVGVAKHALHRERYRRRGHELEASVRVAGAWTGSDFAYHRLDARWARYLPLEGGIRNLNVQLRLGLSDGAPFGEETYDIGGGETLRGVAPGRDVGDLLALVNVEYLDAFFTRPAWRRVLFLDVGNVHASGRFRPLAQNARLGAGLRYKLEALTRTDLRLDVAWDPDDGRVVTYVATDLTF